MLADATGDRTDAAQVRPHRHAAERRTTPCGDRMRSCHRQRKENDYEWQDR